jgi:hypothetical protein
MVSEVYKFFFFSKQHFDTWMDIHCIYGDALDSMADAVEKASVVLICMTENYKESPNCAIGTVHILYDSAH